MSNRKTNYWRMLASLVAGGFTYAILYEIFDPRYPISMFLSVQSFFSDIADRFVDNLAWSYTTIFTSVVLHALPACLVTLLTNRFIEISMRATEPDSYLHCLKCGHILKGISEPRCPECGWRI